jgi:hypothetical protein
MYGTNCTQLIFLLQPEDDEGRKDGRTKDPARHPLVDHERSYCIPQHDAVATPLITPVSRCRGTAPFDKNVALAEHPSPTARRRGKWVVRKGSKARDVL